MQITPQARFDSYLEKGWWKDITIDQLFRKAVETGGIGPALADPPNREALVGDAPQILTFAEVDARVDSMARAFRHLGVGRDDIVLTQLPNLVEGVLAFLACARIGAILSPTAMAYRTHELRSIIGQLNPSLILTVESFHGFNHAEMLQSLKDEGVYTGQVVAVGATSELTSLASIEAQASTDALALVDTRASEVMTVCWTSGTEAAPKGVPRNHAHWLINGESMVEATGLEAGDPLLNPFPLINIASFGGMVIPWLICRGYLIQHHPFDLPVFLQQIQSEKIHYTVAPPAILTMLLKRPELLDGIDFQRIKCIASGSAPLPPFMVKAWQEQFGVPIMNVFGSNEGCSLISSPVVMKDPEQRAIFFPRFGAENQRWDLEFPSKIRTRLVDPDTEAEVTEPGIAAELRIDGAMTFDGYWRNDELNSYAFDGEGFFRTGDLFEISTEDSRFYRFVGRSKEIIIRGGMNISPAELDNLIESHPDVKEAGCAAYPDDRLGEKVCAVIVLQEGAEMTLDSLGDYLKAKDISVYKLPEKLRIVDALPRNPLGKVLRRKLAGIAES